MNTIYKTGYTPKGNLSQRKVKEFQDKDEAMRYGWKLAYKNKDVNTSFFIITEDKKCLRFNKQIIL